LTIVSISVSRDTLNKDYAGKLQRSYDAPTFEVVSAIFRGLTGKKITIPGQFRAATGAFGIKCSLKANEGYLYALEKSLLFIPKPPSHMAHADISHVTFSRVSGGSSRTIDAVFSLRSGVDVSLSNISREEYSGLEDYLKEKKIKVKNELTEETRLPYLGELDDDDDDEARDRSRSKRALGGDDQDDEDEESPDEDFIEASDSDVAEEFNSDYSSEAESGSEEESFASKKRKSEKPTKEQGAKKAKTASTKAKNSSKSDEFVGDSDEDD
jgi:structure-specific recognition protein 1